MNCHPVVLLVLYSLLLLPGLFGCESPHELKLNNQLLNEQLELATDMRDAYEYKQQRIKQTFVQQYLNTREHVTYSVDQVYLPDTSKFGRIDYQDYKYVSLTGPTLLNALEELSAVIRKGNESSYAPNEKDSVLFAQIQAFADGYLINSEDETISFHLNKLSNTTPILPYLGHLEALRLSLIDQIIATQQHTEATTFHDYFTQLSPFLFIPEAERIMISPEAHHVNYSGRIYAIDRYDFNQGLFIKSVAVNNQSLDYPPDNPPYRFVLPVVKNAGDSMRIYLKATAITHEGVDTTLFVERKFKVCP